MSWRTWKSARRRHQVPHCNDQREGAEDEEGQREGEAVAEPEDESLVGTLVIAGVGLGREHGLGIGDRGDLGMAPGVGGTGLIDGSQSSCQFAGQVAAAPSLGIDRLEIAEMFGKSILDPVELLKAALGLLGLALNESDAPGKLVGDLVATTLEFILFPGQFLKTLFFPLDLLLPLAQLQKLVLMLPDLLLKFLGRGILIQSEQLLVLLMMKV